MVHLVYQNHGIICTVQAFDPHKNREINIMKPNLNESTSIHSHAIWVWLFLAQWSREQISLSKLECMHYIAKFLYKNAFSSQTSICFAIVTNIIPILLITFNQTKNKNITWIILLLLLLLLLKSLYFLFFSSLLKKLRIVATIEY